MFGVAAATSARRLRIAVFRPWTAVPIAAGAVPVLCLVLGSGTVPWRPSGVLPMAGILLGGAMTATTLAGQRMFDELRRGRGEYEAALCLGMVPRDAVVEVASDAADDPRRPRGAGPAGVGEHPRGDEQQHPRIAW